MEMCSVFFNAPFFVKALYFIQIEDIICSAISLLGKDTDTGLWKLSTGRQFDRKFIHTELRRKTKSIAGNPILMLLGLFRLAEAMPIMQRNL